MSTRFQARKVQTEEQQAYTPTNWLFAADLDTMAVSISENSGIVKLDLGLGRRNPSLYANEIKAILEKGPELLRYLEDHPVAVDTPPTKKQRAAHDALVNMVTKAKTDQLNAMIKAMRDNQVPEDIIAKAVANFKA
jgi:hypothetical protein